MILLKIRHLGFAGEAETKVEIDASVDAYGYTRCTNGVFFVVHQALLHGVA
jgi:hypothetical protein